ncbi:SGNH/GDSL hydrolase family protein [Parendozoicomonas sp. Alg238-R29]|uniref:SGNH/GDSL hydrolase family protein n=1 Tax=Parendozoicomonas sp. Alg238-R29 TaxID=2993446 RepID=UPI00248DDE3D|nr:SGNH/GDSL hydrolase family protein [Parendozoicomonas sp. Alg238-R29]
MCGTKIFRRFFSGISILVLLHVSHLLADETPITIKHMVVFGNAHSDTGNTRDLFDELAGRKKPSRLREDIRYHGPDVIDMGSSAAISLLLGVGAYATGLDKHLDKIKFLKDYPTLTRLIPLSTLSLALYQTGIGHLLGRPLDYVIDRNELLLKSLLWLYPSVGLPVLPPGQLYNQGGRFTNGSRVWVEVLAHKMGINPDEPSQFISLAYAGSHIRQRLSEEDMLSFRSWLGYMDIGLGMANALFNKDGAQNRQQGFWAQATGNMSDSGKSRFENLLKSGVPPSFEYMVGDYGNRNKYAGVRDPETTLYIIAYGSDDYVIDEANPEEVILVLRESISTLVERDGAKHFLINQLSPLMLPGIAQLPPEKKYNIQRLVDRHNYQLENMITEMQAAHPGVRFITLSDTDKISKTAGELNLSLDPCLHSADNPHINQQDYTLVHVPRLSTKTVLTAPITQDASSLKAAYRFIGKTVARCNEPDKRLFYDNFNLTSRGHTMIAELVCKLLAAEGYQCK